MDLRSVAVIVNEQLIHTDTAVCIHYFLFDTVPPVRFVVVDVHSHFLVVNFPGHLTGSCMRLSSQSHFYILGLDLVYW